jgi:eukaryotic-like serine/threonine-protein kinase
MEGFAFTEASAAQNDGDFPPGTVLGGSYRLIKRLVRGGMGDVHLASHERLPGSFVVKVLSPELQGDEDALARFRQEAMVLADIRHPNVVHLVDFNVTPSDIPYLVMEHLPGRDLADILASRPLLSAVQVSEIVRQVACALDSAHRKGIVHRDMKPENIMVVPCEGQGDLIKVIDFGISKTRRFNHEMAGSMVVGTPEFMSPEQAEGRHEDVDARSDQFALAVTSYLLLTGRTPWENTTPFELLHHIVNNDPHPLTLDGSWPSVEEVLFRGMAKVPSNRYPSTLAFWRALDQAMIKDGLLSAAAAQSLPHVALGTVPRVPPPALSPPLLPSLSPPPLPSLSPPPLPSPSPPSLPSLSPPPLPSPSPPRGLSADNGRDDVSLATTRRPTRKLRRRSPSRPRPLNVFLFLALASGAYLGLRKVTVGGLMADAAERVTTRGHLLFSTITKAPTAPVTDGTVP